MVTDWDEESSANRPGSPGAVCRSSSKPCAPNAIAGNAVAAAKGASRRPVKLTQRQIMVK